MSYTQPKFPPSNYPVGLFVHTGVFLKNIIYIQPGVVVTVQYRKSGNFRC